MSDEVVEVVGSVDNLEDGQYVDILQCLLFNNVVFLAYVYFTDVEVVSFLWEKSTRTQENWM